MLKLIINKLVKLNLIELIKLHLYSKLVQVMCLKGTGELYELDIVGIEQYFRLYF